MLVVPLLLCLGTPSLLRLATPHTEGTGGIYLAKGGNGKKVLVITAYHILFSPNNSNVGYAHTNTSAPCHNILLLSTKAFNNFLDSIKIKIDQHSIMVEHHE